MSKNNESTHGVLISFLPFHIIKAPLSQQDGPNLFQFLKEKIIDLLSNEPEIEV